MKVKLSVLALVLLASAGAHASSYEADADKAKAEIGHAVYKMAVLTGSLTEQGKEAGSRISNELANKFTVKFDDMISAGINKGESCENITKYFRETLLPGFSAEMGKGINPDVMNRFISRFEPATISYVSNRCAFLTE